MRARDVKAKNPTLPSTTKWPKALPPLTPAQQRVSDEFMKLWHEVLPRRFGAIEAFNHGFPVRHSPRHFRTTLELGAGMGEHLRYERLTPEQSRHYYALELRGNMEAEIRKRFPAVQTIVGDCQGRLPFDDGFFDRVIAVHVLEHLPDLPATIREAHRLLDPKSGRFLAVVPTEGSLAYTLARKVSAERLYKKHFGGDYSWLHRREHINRVDEILAELHGYFTIVRHRFFPLPFLPFAFNNLCLGLAMAPQSAPVRGQA
jgi:SAM-dependent methyltransferase